MPAEARPDRTAIGRSGGARDRVAQTRHLTRHGGILHYVLRKLAARGR
ncbi:MAG: hypothetical protein OZ919_03590 [Xanthomonadaceae bacterium]|nr:hypothetical protein [Xanthomonadaceae bacterium]